MEFYDIILQNKYLPYLFVIISSIGSFFNFMFSMKGILGVLAVTMSVPWIKLNQDTFITDTFIISSKYGTAKDNNDKTLVKVQSENGARLIKGERCLYLRPFNCRSSYKAGFPKDSCRALHKAKSQYI